MYSSLSSCFQIRLGRPSVPNNSPRSSRIARCRSLGAWKWALRPLQCPGQLQLPQRGRSAASSRLA
eukprot:6486326-Prorocentrum_lima.AAC.1